MPGLNSIMDTSLSALFAAQAGLATTGHNIANANTPGYSRQTVLFAARRPDMTSVGAIGRGVDVQGIRRIQDEFLLNNLRSQTARGESYGSVDSALSEVESILGSIDNDHLGVVVADVSGKGIPAALFMAMSKSLIRSAAEDNTHSDQIIIKANNILSRDNEQGMFVTVFLGIYNMTTRELSYTSAGHNPPYLVTASGDIQQITPKPGFVLGGFEGTPYVSEKIQLNKGDGLYVYSDGVTEAMSETNEEYGESRLESALKKNAMTRAEELNRGVLVDLKQFVGSAQQSDDITMLFVRV